MCIETEPAIDGVAGDIPGIHVDWLYTAPSFGFTFWNCRTGQRALTGERMQLWHVISFIYDGAFILHSEGRAEVVDRATVMTYNPQAPYRSAHPYGCDDHGSALVVRSDLLAAVMSRFDPTAGERPQALFPAVVGRDVSRAYLLHRALVSELAAGGAADPVAVESRVLTVLEAVARASCREAGKRPAAAPESTRARRNYVHDAQAILRERFRERLRIEEIADALYVSPFHLCRLFQRETGLPLHRYLNRLRLREALERLADGTDLTDLALGLGFSCHSHFTTAFRKEFGVPPSEARRLLAGSYSQGMSGIRSRSTSPPS